MRRRFPVGKIAKKSSLNECVFVNSALKIQRHIVKNTLLQTAFSAILPTGFEFSRPFVLTLILIKIIMCIRDIA